MASERDKAKHWAKWAAAFQKCVEEQRGVIIICPKPEEKQQTLAFAHNLAYGKEKDKCTT